MSNKTQQTTFWHFLQKAKIEIPIIQRDYAQGRKGKEKLREIFMKDLKNALDGELPNEEKILKLDFVYGSVENGNLNPLDGQQRLTTLWLLHWYIAYKAGKLAENVETFKRFTYETRVSSREFCNKLSEFTEQPPGGKGIVDHIQNQTWFFLAWKQDPTIQAMLNMLGGTSMNDGIEELFGEECDYWEQLTSDNCPIIFYYLSLDELEISDDLYIKMNARGKTLTDFENFKANLVGHLRKKAESKEWKAFVSDFEHKVDTNWTDIFWKSRSKEYKIDEIYFAFFNRYFLNALITAKNSEAKYIAAESIENHDTYKHLYEEKKEYSAFDIYNPKEGEDDIFSRITYENLANTLNDFYKLFKDKDINNLFLPAWYDGKFKFIPEYQDDSISGLTANQRIIFHAICRYFEYESYEKATLEQWMRVACNIVENSPATMIGTMRLIDELADHSHGIYAFLANLDNEISSDAAKDQVAEERAKAKQIINDKTATWESKIIEAEKTAFFKGAIRFMFTNERGNYDWSLFDDRLEKSQHYFDVNGVIKEYKTDALLLRVLISKFDQQDNFKQIYYNSKPNNWKNEILTNTKLTKAVSALFDESIGEDYNFDTFSTDWTEDERLRMCHKDLLTSKFLVRYEDEDRALYDRWGKHVLHTHNKRDDWVIIGDKRNEILAKLFDNQIITSHQKIQDVPYFWHWDISFKYKGQTYQWNRNNYIYLLKENGYPETDTEGEEIKIPCADVNAENITEKLDSLILN
ncbi:MAG: DUF262 domain-containing protein [Prevotellaceae bacterium]|jgi:hypothetical protein|nr:DUF262 domain-containing protein [Prevotellaceae bacterium]